MSIENVVGLEKIETGYRNINEQKIIGYDSQSLNSYYDEYISVLPDRTVNLMYHLSRNKSRRINQNNYQKKSQMPKFRFRVMPMLED